jgi:hypothetical protein
MAELRSAPLGRQVTEERISGALYGKDIERHRCSNYIKGNQGDSESLGRFSSTEKLES